MKQTLIKALRQEHKYRRTQKSGKTEEKRGKIADMLSTEERPAEVADRTVPGHWEGDLILGKYKRSALGTLVERTTRYTILVPLGSQVGFRLKKRAPAQAAAEQAHQRGFPGADIPRHSDEFFHLDLVPRI